MSSGTKKQARSDQTVGKPQGHKKNHKRPRHQQDVVVGSSGSGGGFGAGRCVSVSDRYEKVGRVGEGTYGIVYKARDRETGKYVALKRCIPHHQSSDGFPITTLREIQSLRICSAHHNIVRLEDVAVSKNGVFLVFEYCEHDLADLLDCHYQKHRRSPFHEASAKTLLSQLLEALDYVHSRHLIHRDLKVSNLLYTNGGLLKVADFGLSRPYSDHFSMTQKVASLWYRPPELLLGSTTYTQSIDMWATGCIFAEILRGRPILDGKTETDQIDKIFQCVGVPTLAAAGTAATTTATAMGSASVTEWPGFRNLPLVRDGSVDIPRRSTRSLLDDFSFLSVTGLRLLTCLLRLDPDSRWTAKRALASAYLTKEPPEPTPVHRMPQFPSQHGS